MDLHFLSGFSRVPLGNGYLGRRVAKAFKSVRISIYKCVRVSLTFLGSHDRTIPFCSSLSRFWRKMFNLPGQSAIQVYPTSSM